MSPQLTRYLYFLDECLYSLMFCLIRAQKSTLEEIIFWAGEIYYSGYHDLLWEHLWKIYYDFYAIKYPKYEKKINAMSKKKISLENIIIILNLFYYSKPTYEVFILRMLSPQSPTHVYIGRTPSWLKTLEIDAHDKRLIRSIHNNKKINIVFYLRQSKNYQKTYEAIKKYYTSVHGFQLKKKCLESIAYKNKIHMLLALICHLELDINNIQKRTIYRKIDDTLLTKEIEFNSEVVEPLYQTLVSKRLYTISPLVGAFKLKRYSTSIKDYRDILRLHWDYFIYNCPLWKKRIKSCNGTLNHEKYELIFKNDDDHEKFYESYNYEPDEQSQEIQDKSICYIDNTIGEHWMTNISNHIGIHKYSLTQLSY